jgi:hypothetical protein
MSVIESLVVDRLSMREGDGAKDRRIILFACPCGSETKVSSQAFGTEVAVKDMWTFCIRCRRLLRKGILG